MKEYPRKTFFVLQIFLLVLMSFFIFACAQPTLSDNYSAADTDEIDSRATETQNAVSSSSVGQQTDGSVTVDGDKGSVIISNMSNSSLTVTYIPSSSADSVRLYLSEGNGQGLVLASQSMDNTEGVYSYTFSHPSFTEGAVIKVAVLINTSGVETCVPQGIISDVSTWASFTYAEMLSEDDSSGVTNVDTGGSVAGSTELTGVNGSVIISGMTNNSLTVTYAPSVSVSNPRLYISEGNGMGLVLASQAMVLNNGKWSYTFSHPSFVDDAVIYLTVLANTDSGEICVPQGILSDVTTWVSFIYGALSEEGFVVTFDSQGADFPATPFSITVMPPATSVAALPSPPEKEGYTFGGWYTLENGNGDLFTEDYVVNSDMTVYAKWMEDKDHNNGSLDLSGPNGSIYISDMTANSLTVSYKPDSPVDSAKLYLSEGNGKGLVLASQIMANTGGTYSYTFSHPSFTDGAVIKVAVLANKAGIEKCIPQGVLGDITTWADFKYGFIPYTYYVTFDSQGADKEAIPHSISVSSPATTVDSLPQEPVKDGAVFMGWYTMPDGKGEPFTASTPVTSDMTVYAYWLTGTLCNISFLSPEADIPASPESLSFVAGQALGKLPTPPVRSGYEFAGWNTSIDGSGLDVTEDTVLETDTVVYAQWKDVAYNLLSLNDGMYMTMQFVNKTRGTWSDDQIYITILARNEAGDWCYLKPNGTLQPMSLGDNGQLEKNGRLCANYSFKLSDIDGFQLPPYVASGRAFVSIGEPLYLSVVIDGDGKIGYTAPDLNNETDPNRDVYFDWYEFSVVPATWVTGSPVGFWGNTTQVDQLSIPLMAYVYEKNATGGGTLIGQNGISESRNSLWQAWKNEVPEEFQGLLDDYRINAPCKSKNGFGDTGPYSDYYNSYVDQIWEKYRHEDLVFDMYWNGKVYTYRGKVQGDAFVFSREGRSNFVVVARKPTTKEIFEASGVLATGNTEEGAIQARIDAAFNRSVMENSLDWDKPNAFYQKAPANFYSKFMHEHAYGKKAYGFAYDDVGDFSGLIWTYNARAVVIEINW